MDARWRRLERVATLGGEHEARRALRARVRAGALSHERVLLAAYLGDATAGALVGGAVTHLRELDPWLRRTGLKPRLVERLEWARDWERSLVGDLEFNGCCFYRAEGGEGWCAVPGPRLSGLFAWAAGLTLWDPALAVRAGIAAARFSADLAVAWLQADVDDHLAAIGAWLACPCEAHEEETVHRPLEHWRWLGREQREAVQPAVFLLRAVAERDPREVARLIGEAVHAAGEVLLDPDGVREGIARALRPAAFGDQSPGLDEVPRLAPERAAGRALAERVDAETLALLAHLGHPPARLALPGCPPEEPDLEAWVRGLTRWGRDPLVTAATAAARHVHGRWTRGGLPRAALHCAERFVADGEPTTAGVTAERTRAWLMRLEADAIAAEDEPGLHAARAAGAACASVVADRPTWAAVEALDAARAALHDPGAPPAPWDVATRERTLRAAIRDAVHAAATRALTP